MLSIFHYSFIQNAFLAGSVVAVVGGFVGYFLVTRGLTFAGHALSHIGFAGAAAALLVGVDPIFGLLVFTIVAGAMIGVFGKELREEDVNIGIVMTLALGLGALFISLYNGYAEQAYSILFGTILGISRTDVLVTARIRHRRDRGIGRDLPPAAFQFRGPGGRGGAWRPRALSRYRISDTCGRRRLDVGAGGGRIAYLHAARRSRRHRHAHRAYAARRGGDVHRARARVHVARHIPGGDGRVPGHVLHSDDIVRRLSSGTARHRARMISRMAT